MYFICLIDNFVKRIVLPYRVTEYRKTSSYNFPFIIVIHIFMIWLIVFVVRLREYEQSSPLLRLSCGSVYSKKWP